MVNNLVPCSTFNSLAAGFTLSSSLQSMFTLTDDSDLPIEHRLAVDDSEIENIITQNIRESRSVTLIVTLPLYCNLGT